MNMLKLTAAAALVAASLSASARSSITDEDLSAVAGQDGVSIAANLNVNIGSFQYTANGSSVNFNNINITGLVAMTIDVLTNGAALTEFTPIIAGYDTANAVANGTKIATWLGGSDVVQFAFPNLGVTHALSPSITVGSITLGSGTASFGGFAINHLDLQGTTVLMWAH